MEWLAEVRMVWYLWWCAGIAVPMLGQFHRAAERENHPSVLWSWPWEGPWVGLGDGNLCWTYLVAKPFWQRGCPWCGVSARTVSTSLVFWHWMSRLLEASHRNQAVYLRDLNIFHKCFPELPHPVSSKCVSSWDTSIISVTHGILGPRRPQKIT